IALIERSRFVRILQKRAHLGLRKEARKPLLSFRDRHVEEWILLQGLVSAKEATKGTQGRHLAKQRIASELARLQHRQKRAHFEPADSSGIGDAGLARHIGELG